MIDVDKELERLRRVQDDWDSCGAESPSESAIRMATAVLAELNELGLVPNVICPSTDGAVCIEFWREGKYADIECFNSGEILAVTSNYANNENPLIWNALEPSLRDTILLIKTFIATAETVR